MIYDFKVTGYDSEFNGIIKQGNNTFKLKRVIDGEMVQADITLKPTPSARLTKVIKQSDVRVRPKCEFYLQCGGCALQHIKYEEQLKMKQVLVSNLFKDTFDKEYEALWVVI